jgi:hypothetical protein
VASLTPKVGNAEKMKTKKYFSSLMQTGVVTVFKWKRRPFKDPTVIAYVNRHFVPISVNSDKEQKIAAKYNVRGLPSTWFISENGDRIGNRPGVY